MKQVGFLTPENKGEYMDYHDVLNYCKAICEEERQKDKFLHFQKDYITFTPYFDYVMFELNYVFLDPLFRRGKCLTNIDSCLYLVNYQDTDYENIRNEALEEHLKATTKPYMGKVSEGALAIEEASPDKVTDSLISPDLISMMSSFDNFGSSHEVTANTMMHQLLCLSDAIKEDYDHYVKEESLDQDSEALNYMVQKLGFLRATSPDVYPMLVGNWSSLTKKEKDFVNTCKENGYHFFSLDVESNSLTEEYEGIKKR